MSNIRAAYPRKGVVQPRILRLLAQPVREMPQGSRLCLKVAPLGE